MMDYSSRGRDIVDRVDMGSNHPEDADLLRLYNHLRTYVYADFFRALDEDEKYYRLKFGKDIIPKDWRDRGFDVTLPPTAYNAVEAATDHILTTPEIIVPERASDSDYLEEQVLASHKAQFLKYWWRNVSLKGDPLKAGIKKLIKEGKCVFKKEVAFDRLNRAAISQSHYFPWNLTLLPNQNVMEDPDNPYDPSYVFEFWETTVDNARRTYPEAKGEWRNKRAYEKVKVVEFWCKPDYDPRHPKGRRVIWVESERVINAINPYTWVCGYKANGKEIYEGYTPYFIADTMWGEGDRAAPPHERYVGMIRMIHSLIEAEARQLSMADAQLRIGTFPIVMITGATEDEDKPMKIGPGAKIFLQTDQKMETLVWPNLDSSLFAMISRVHQYTNELSKFEQLSGSPVSGIDTATEAQQSNTNAAAKLEGPKGAIQNLMMRVSSSNLCEIENVIEEPVSLTGYAADMPGTIAIAPHEIAGSWEVWCTLKTSSEAELNRADLMAWANAYQVFGLDKAYAMKMAGIDNPQQRRANRWKENIEDDPRMHELRLALAMQQQGGELGAMLAQGVVEAMIRGMAPPDPMMAGMEDETGGAESGGGFPPMLGMPSNRNQIGTAPQETAGQGLRANAMMTQQAERPDQAMQ